jgi:hypothetical protein
LELGASYRSEFFHHRPSGMWSRRVFRALDTLGFPYETEVCPFDERTVEEYGIWRELFAIDVANEERMIAIELDGPTHTLLGGQRNGTTKAKRRLLERLGWKVLTCGLEDSIKLQERGMEEEVKWWREALEDVGWRGDE